MKQCWIVYWREPKNGVEPLGLIAAFDSRDKAYEFLYKPNTFTVNQRENLIGITSCPERSDKRYW